MIDPADKAAAGRHISARGSSLARPARTSSSSSRTISSRNSTRANILDIRHARTSLRGSAEEVGVQLTSEARDAEHAGTVSETLRAAAGAAWIA